MVSMAGASPVTIILENGEVFEENQVDVQPEPPEEAETPGATESDMILTPEQKTALENDIEGLQTRKAHADVTKRWPGAIVPCEISSTSQGDTDVILSAIQYWESVSCLKFPAYSASAGHTSRIRFIKDAGCWSYVGLANPGGAQDISIGSGCAYRGTIAHEIGHAIGFWHEQSRSDRDDYVIIHSENIQSGKEHNFRKYTSATINSYGVAYDPGSLMHYGTHYFSKNGQPTISAKNPADQAKIGQRNYLSAADIELANIIYNCPAGVNKIYGIGTDRKIYSRDDIQGTWSGPAPNSCCIIAMTVLHDGTIVGVGTSNRLWTKSSLDAT
uniref:Metalloendopeptidase n=1 Tax=Saccoglossus kowalevskii TaxID=10224 RepID=A0ABM0GSF6_SACKO|nr:PREDICTED: blastula protease 10-like [Saccoglossus kowalevskii]